MHYQRSHITTETFEDFIVNGKPAGEVHWLVNDSSRGDGLYSGIWRTGPLTFDYVFPGDEIFHALRGELHIAIRDSETIIVREGDIIAFDKGIKTTWTIPEVFVKFFVIT